MLRSNRRTKNGKNELEVLVSPNDSILHYEPLIVQTVRAYYDRQGTNNGRLSCTIQDFWQS